MQFRKSAARDNKYGSIPSRRKLQARAMVLDRLESRVMLSATNNGYAFTTLASMSGTSTQAQIPYGPLVEDANGDLFGASLSGGTDHDGAIFEIPAGSGTVQTLVSFNGANGQEPFESGLVMDASGNLYGTTDSGGSDNAGVVFEIPESNPNTIAVLGSLDSGVAVGYTVVVDGSGDVFGTTTNGGAHDTGSIWEIPAGDSNVQNVGAAPTTIASFAALSSGHNATGAYPEQDMSLVLKDGTIYGTTSSGGTDGDGTVFSESTGTITGLGSFTSEFDGQGNVVVDGSGNIFGASSFGGTGDGYIFELQNGQTTPTDLANFNGSDGEDPSYAIVEDGNGNIFGSTTEGGSGDHGVVYEMPTTGGDADTILPLTDFSLGSSIDSGIIADGNGNLFGTTLSSGTNGEGSVFEVTPVHLVVSGVPSLFSDSPSTISPTVTLEGPTGDTITNSNDESPLVTLSIDDGGTVINNTATASDGVASFPDLAVTTPGSDYTLTATDANDDASGASGEFTVAPQPDDTSTHLAFLTQPVYNDGQVPTVTVGIKNAAGAIVTTDDSIVTLTEESGPGDLEGTLTEQAVNGEVSFTDLTVTEAGVYKLTASDDDLTTATSKTFTAIAVPTSLDITSGPTDPLTAGVPSAANVVVKVLDQFGDPINKGGAAVQLTVVDGEGRSISLGTANEVNGVATFRHIKVDTSGDFELGAASKGVEADFHEIEVEPAAGANIAFVLGPPDTTAGAAFSISVQVLDKFGNLATGNDSDITLSLTGNSDGSLSGTRTVAASDGVATFFGLSITRAGKYQIVATDPSLHKSIRTRVFLVA